MPIISPTIKLNNGKEMPVLGLGTWKSKPGEVKQAVEDAIDAGYRHFDCAYFYCNEPEVGAGIKTKIDAGVVKREDLFIVSKAWNTFRSAPAVDVAIRETLKNLELDYLDLYLIHWPLGYKEGGSLTPQDENGKTVYSDVDYLDTWKAFENCVRLGLTKSIGISNFNSVQVQRILDNCTIKPVTNQVECHPWLNQTKLIKYCHDRGVIVTAYSPFASPDRPWAKPTDPVLFDDPKLKALAAKYKKTVSQIMLRYQTQRGLVVIPKSVTKARIIENMDCHDFTMSDEDMMLIDSMDCNGRICAMEWVVDHPHYPFHIEF